MSREQNIATVKQLYADVATRNFDGIFNVLTDDIRWEPPFVPEIHHTRLRNGKTEVKDGITELAAEIFYALFTPQTIYADTDAVIVKGIFEGKANNTGKPFSSDWVHIWRFRGDKICSYQAFWNTYTVASALK